MAKIFICYRRGDTSGHAGRLHDHLAARFGKQRIYRDIDNIPLGTDFAEEVRKTLKGCAAVIVLIGQRWMTGESGMRLGTPSDLLREEIAQALTSKAMVFPVLVDGASMPTQWELPSNIQDLAKKHAVEIRDVSFAADFEQLARALERLEGLKPRAARKTAPKKTAAKRGKAEPAKDNRENGTGSGTRRPRKPRQPDAGTTTPVSSRGGEKTGAAEKDTAARTAKKTARKRTPKKPAAESSPPPAKRPRGSKQQGGSTQQGGSGRGASNQDGSRQRGSKQDDSRQAGERPAKSTQAKNKPPSKPRAQRASDSAPTGKKTKDSGQGASKTRGQKPVADKPATAKTPPAKRSGGSGGANRSGTAAQKPGAKQPRAQGTKSSRSGSPRRRGGGG